MSNYTRTTYVIVGGKGYRQWEDFASGIFTQVLVNKGKGFVIDRQSVQQENLECFMDPGERSVLAVINVEIEDVLADASFDYLHDFIWATCKFGDPGKIVVLGHGSLTATVGAYTTPQKDVYVESSQRKFISSIFPDWPPPLPRQVAQDPGITGAQGLRVIALRQCYGARTSTAYVAKTSLGSYEAATGSAAAITGEALRAKGWNGSGATVTASPEYNIFHAKTGKVEMATVMPKVEGGSEPTQKSTPRVKLPQSHKVKHEEGKSFIETDTRFSGPVAVKDEDGSWWKTAHDSAVFYPDHWIRTKKWFTWRISIPEYVVPDPFNNTIESISPEQSMHLKHHELKIRIVL